MHCARAPTTDDPLPNAVVDAHHHLWDLGRFPYPWLAPQAPPRPFGNHDAIKRDFLTADYRKLFDGLPLAASVHVQANCGAADPSEESAWLSELSFATGWPNAIVGGVNLACESAGAILAAHARYPLVKGVRAMIAHDRAGRWRFSNRPHVMTEQVFRKNAAYLAEIGFSLDLVVVPEQLAEVAQLAAALPDLTIIIDHLGTPEPESYSTWISGVGSLSRFENVAMKLSGLWTIDKTWRPERLAPYVRHALLLLGGDRLMYGSNAPIETLNCSVTDQISTLASLVKETDHAALNAVFRETAVRLYRLQIKSD